MDKYLAAEYAFQNGYKQGHHDAIVAAKNMISEHEACGWVGELPELYWLEKLDKLSEKNDFLQAKEGYVSIPKEEYDYLQDAYRRYDPFWFCTFGGCEGASRECKKTCEMSILVKTKQEGAKDFYSRLNNKFFDFVIDETKGEEFAKGFATALVEMDKRMRELAEEFKINE